MKFPIEYRWLRANNFNGLRPWHFLDQDDIEGLRKEYQLETNLDILPFARRQDNDDIAGFVIQNGQVEKEVVSVHLTWSGKIDNPSNRSYETLFDWLSEVLLYDTIEWITEEEIKDLNKAKVE